MASTSAALPLAALGLLLCAAGAASLLWPDRTDPPHTTTPNRAPTRRLWGASRFVFGAAFLLRAGGELAADPSQHWMRTLASIEFLCLCAIGTAFGLRANRLHRLRTWRAGRPDPARDQPAQTDDR